MNNPVNIVSFILENKFRQQSVSTYFLSPFFPLFIFFP